MGSYQPEKLDCLCKNSWCIANVRFSRKRSFKTLQNRSNEGPLSANSGHRKTPLERGFPFKLLLVWLATAHRFDCVGVSDCLAAKSLTRQGRLYITALKTRLLGFEVEDCIKEAITINVLDMAVVDR